jgi:hypothetical protein
MLDTISGNVLDDVKSAYTTVKHSVGNIVRAPGEVAQSLSTTAKGVGAGVSSTSKTIPIVLIIAGVGIAGYLLYMGKAGKKITPSISGSFPELMGRKHRR